MYGCYTLSVVLYVILNLNGILKVSGHPQCLDYRPPFELEDDLRFCTEYASYGCCTHERDAQLKSEYESILDNVEINDSNNCKGYIKDIICQECSPYAAHIYNAETGPGDRTLPGLCSDYCSDFYRQCNAYINLITGSDSELITYLAGGPTSFCNHIALTDVDYCYPELLTNAVLNGDIEREAITRDGCLCLEPFASLLRNPVSLKSPPDGTGRVFISEQVGVVHIYYKNGTKLEEPFMDITHMVLTSTREGDERGFLGLVFHPDYETDGRVFTYFSITHENSQRVRISEFRVSDEDPNKVDEHSERILLEVDQPYANHNGGEVG